MISRVRMRRVEALPVLWRMVLRFVYDRAHMPVAECRRMERALRTWRDKVELDLTMGQLLRREAEPLAMMARMLVEDEQGKFEERKRLFKEHGIDYRKFYRLPEAYTAADRARAQRLGAASDHREGVA